MTHKVFKVVRRIYSPHAQTKRQRISCSTRHREFMLTYPVNAWFEAPIGLSFVFVDEHWARTYHEAQPFDYELWKCESEDEPQRMYGMATRWQWIGLFWEYYHQGDIASLAKVCIACPESYYGVKKIRLVSCLS